MKPSEIEKIIVDYLEKTGLVYEEHKANEPLEEYKYLNGNDICITVKNPQNKYKLYIDLEDGEENTITYYKWHKHYYYVDPKFIIKDLKDIFENRKCPLIIESTKSWICSNFVEENKNDNIIEKKVKLLPENLQKELEELGGTAEFFYWDSSLNKIININKKEK